MMCENLFRPFLGICQRTPDNSLNLALYHPKKDQCDYCGSYKAGHVEEEVWQNHWLKKDEACQEKAADKDKATESGKLMVACMDLQALLLCPKLRASSLHYKTKLAVHNFTLYNMANHSGTSYVRIFKINDNKNRQVPDGDRTGLGVRITQSASPPIPQRSAGGRAGGLGMFRQANAGMLPHRTSMNTALRRTGATKNSYYDTLQSRGRCQRRMGITVRSGVH
ncbi:hypothetical protein MHYP_G00035740 [Metynnis hypsauchen]